MKRRVKSGVFGKLSNAETIENKCLNSFFNPYSYLVVRKKFSGIDCWSVDGQFSVLLLRLIGFNVKRRSFDMTSLAPEVFGFCEQNSKSLVFIGSSSEDIEYFVRDVIERYPRLNIKFYRNGFFESSADFEETQSKVVECNPDFVICGMGAGRQEMFLIKLRESGWCGTGYTCGGFIHQTASSGLKYYPTWADNLNLRWFYRIIDEPRLIKRYVMYYPFFPFVLLFDYLKNRKA